MSKTARPPHSADRENPSPSLTVGSVAEWSGLTVRTLHHWDQIGLLSPVERAPNGYRLYRPEDLERLQQILSLRQTGLGLDAIKRLLESGEIDPQQVLTRQLAHLRQQQRETHRVVSRLQRLLRHYEQGEMPSVSSLLKTLKEMAVFEKYYTPEQLAVLEDRKEQVGAEEIAAVEKAWVEIASRVGEAIESDLPLSSPAVGQLARDWRALTRRTVQGFTGGDPNLGRSAARLLRSEPQVSQRWGMSEEMGRWIQSALEHHLED